MSAAENLSPLQFPSPHQHGGELSYLHDDENPRCTFCGHRATDPLTGERPGQTRDKGPKAWLVELPRRLEARRV